MSDLTDRMRQAAETLVDASRRDCPGDSDYEFADWHPHALRATADIWDEADAAEAAHREADIESLAIVLGSGQNPPGGMMKACAERAYDAGYRKVEE